MKGCSGRITIYKDNGSSETIDLYVAGSSCLESQIFKKGILKHPSLVYKLIDVYKIIETIPGDRLKVETKEFKIELSPIEK